MATIEHDYAPVCDLYERHLGPALFELYAEDLARRVADCAEGSVLEMAFGTGILTQQLRTHLQPSVSLIATDINPGMVHLEQSSRPWQQPLPALVELAHFVQRCKQSW